MICTFGALEVIALHTPEVEPKRRSVPAIAAALLATAFGAAAIAKLGSTGQLASLIAAAALAPPWLASHLAVAVVAGELLLAAALLVRPVRGPALWASAATLLAYAGFGVWRLLGGIEAPCNCFGPLLRSTPGLSIAVSLALLAIAVAAITSTPNRKGGDARA